MKHKDKVKLARKMRTKTEIKKKTRVPIFQTIAWSKRKSARLLREIKKKERMKGK